MRQGRTRITYQKMVSCPACDQWLPFHATRMDDQKWWRCNRHDCGLRTCIDCGITVNERTGRAMAARSFPGVSHGTNLELRERIPPLVSQRLDVESGTETPAQEPPAQLPLWPE